MGNLSETLTGYVQKKIVQKVADCKAILDGTVRDAGGNIVQFMYGGDGINPKRLMNVRGLPVQFFMDPMAYAEIFNAKALQDEGGDVSSLGVKRKFSKTELDAIASLLVAGCPGVPTEVTEMTTYNTRTMLKHAMKDVEIYESKMGEFSGEIRKQYEQSKVEPGDMVGLVAACSIGEVATQLTLNSVDWYTPIYIRAGKKEVIFDNIGNIIDTFMKECSSRVTRPNPDTEYLDVTNLDLQVTSVDEDGKMHWKKLEGLTRHLPGGKLVHVKTASGREVIATKGHSFLTRKKNRLAATYGSDLKVGDFVPIVKNNPAVKDPLMVLDMKYYLPPTEYLYMSDMQKAWKEYQNVPNKGWWKGKGRLFQLPYSRSDVFTDGYRTNKIKNGLKDKCVYPKKTGTCRSEIPERLPLDWVTGYLFGAYAAEGCVTETFVCISNNDPKFRKHVYEFCDRYNIGHHTVVQNDKNFEGATSTDIKIHSTMLAKLLGDSCGRRSANKVVPEWMFIANKEFLRGYLMAYFSGDGYVIERDGIVGCSSSSKDLIIGVGELLAHFGIYGYWYVVQPKKNNVGSNEILPSHVLRLPCGNSVRFAKEIRFVIDYKNKVLDDVTLKKNTFTNSLFDVIPIDTGTGEDQYIHFDKIRKLIPNAKEPLKTVYKQAIDQDVFYDEIVSIEEVESSHSEVYDLTVADTKTFSTFGGFLMYDTFHLAGNSAKDITLGVPRLKEVLNATKKLSKTSCTIVVDNDAIRERQERIRKVEELIKTNEKIAEEEKEEKRKELEDLKFETLKETDRFAQSLVSLTVGDLLDSKDPYELRYLPTTEGEPRKQSPLGLVTYEEYEPQWWVTLSKDLGNIPQLEPDGWVLLLKFDVSKLYRYKLTLNKIAERIEEDSRGSTSCAMACVPSPNNIGQIEVYLNLPEVKSYIQCKMDLPDAEASSRELLTAENVDYFTAREVAMDVIRKTKVQGIHKIHKAYARQDDKTGAWLVDTAGSNYLEVLATPGVDYTRTTCDNMWEVAAVLGIEAVRTFIAREITKVITFDGGYVNPRHMFILVDKMIRTGKITSVSRYGIERDVGPFGKGCFEKAIENFAESAAFTEVDGMKGLSANVMMGTTAKIGTGTVEVKDAEKMPVRRKAVVAPIGKKT